MEGATSVLVGFIGLCEVSCAALRDLRVILERGCARVYRNLRFRESWESYDLRLAG